MKPTRTWIVIADGARARIALHEKAGAGITQIDGLDFRVPHPADTDIVADRPGRTFDSHGPGRHAMEPPTDPHRKNKADFARMIADFLAEKLQEDAYDRLVIIAPATTLGDLRTALDDKVATRVLAELPKDLTQVRNDQLADHLGDVLPV